MIGPRQRPRPAMKTGADPRAVQRATAAADKKDKSTELELADFDASWGSCGATADNGLSHGDHSWQSNKSLAAQRVQSDPPVARWYVDDGLNVNYIDTSPVRSTEAKSAKHDLIRRVLSWYVRQQEQFIRSGDLASLKPIRPQRHEYEAIFQLQGDELKELKSFTAAVRLRTHYLYLPDGRLCAASLLHSAAEKAERQAFLKVLEIENEHIKKGLVGFSAATCAKHMSALIGYEVTAAEFRQLCKKHSVPPSVHARTQQYRATDAVDPREYEAQQESEL